MEEESSQLRQCRWPSVTGLLSLSADNNLCSPSRIIQSSPCASHGLALSSETAHMPDTLNKVCKSWCHVAEVYALHIWVLFPLNHAWHYKIQVFVDIFLDSTSAALFQIALPCSSWNSFWLAWLCYVRRLICVWCQQNDYLLLKSCLVWTLW